MLIPHVSIEGPAHLIRIGDERARHARHRRHEPGDERVHDGDAYCGVEVRHETAIDW